MVWFMLSLQSGLNPLFVWGVEKCLETNIPRPLNPHRKLVMKNISKVWQEISPGHK
jgi:hypothetical protein